MEDEHPVIPSNEACKSTKTSRTVDEISHIFEGIDEMDLDLVRNDS